MLISRTDVAIGVRIGSQLLAAGLSLAILLASGYAWASYRKLEGNLRTVSVDPRTVGNSAGDADGSDQNILIVGDDSHAGATPQELADLSTEQNLGENTDTIMLLHVPANGTRASVISFPRDSLVQLPDGSEGTINSVYQSGLGPTGDIAAGVRALTGVVSKLVDLRIDHFVKISMLGFYRISNAIHGVEVNLCAAQNKDTENDDGLHPNGYSGIDLKRGWNHIQGKQAMAFVRQRHGLAGGDYARIVRQEYFLAAAFRKVATPAFIGSPGQVSRLLDAVSGLLVVDEGLKGRALIAFAGQLQNLTAGNLAFSPIPMLGAQGSGDSYRGEAIDTAAMPAFIAKLIGQPTAYQKAGAAPPSAVPHTVPPTGSAPPAGPSSDPAIRTAADSSCVN
jgi:LCP family protein required for cell wall assembly